MLTNDLELDRETADLYLGPPRWDYPDEPDDEDEPDEAVTT